MQVLASTQEGLHGSLLLLTEPYVKRLSPVLQALQWAWSHARSRHLIEGAKPPPGILVTECSPRRLSSPASKRVRFADESLPSGGMSGSSSQETASGRPVHAVTPASWSADMCLSMAVTASTCGDGLHSVCCSSPKGSGQGYSAGKIQSEHHRQQHQKRRLRLMWEASLQAARRSGFAC